MNKIASILVLVLAFSAFAQGKRYYGQQNKGETVSNSSEYWFEQQLLDHFIQVPIQYWKQRYFVQDEFYQPINGPLLLNIGGEGVAHPVGDNQLIMELAKKFGGIVVTLEHRFYGASQPFGQTDSSYSLDNLKYLTHEQALEDLATFIGYLKKNNMYGIHEYTPVITIGGSYPGALSAWFRQKYRHLTIGALASSAVVNTIDDYQEFDMQIRLSTEQYSDECAETIRTLTAHAEEQVSNPLTANAFKKKFGAEQLSKVDFLYFFADIFALQVQYSQTTDACEMISGDLDSQLENIQNYAVNNCNPDDYDQAVLKETGYGEKKNIRQWTYQTCTFVGWFYSAAFYLPMRSKLVDLEYFHDLCQNVYGEDYLPNTKQTNVIMGGTQMRVNNIIFTNGGQDPWKWASILEDVGDMKAYVIDCMDCGHCIDLGSNKPDQPEILTETREKIALDMEYWIAEYWDNIPAMNIDL